MSDNHPMILHRILIWISVALGLFLLFAISVEFLEMSLFISLIGGIFLFYMIFILPRLDYRIFTSSHPPGAEKQKQDALGRYRSAIIFLALTILTFVILHLAVLVMHEFSHSFFACLLGAKQDPLHIIYGSWIGSHWDENVDYTSLFSAGLGHTAAAIAFAGPLSNIVLFFVTVGLLSVRAVKNHPWIYHCIYWAMVITFVMIFEYVFTRSFIAHDDFGNINHGLGITPWPIFIAGTVLGLIGLWYILGKKTPEYYAIVVPKQIPHQYVLIGTVSFVIFLFYIGTSILAYPEIPRWWCGLAGIIALFIAPFLVSPYRRWVRNAIKGDLPP
ncbi:MAG: hypothetical protein JXA44_08825 [Methanospirillaceae archaeon]|nr:hypothetical protein [Methanospirillaceae archaeon]